MGCAVSGVGVQNWLTKPKLKQDVTIRNYYTLLNSQVEELEPTEKLCNLQIATTQHPEAIRGNH